jgi:hypothetical protein
VIQSVTSLNPLIKSLDASCFDGIYVTADITSAYLDDLEKGRGKGRKGASTTADTTTASLSIVPPVRTFTPQPVTYHHSPAVTPIAVAAAVTAAETSSPENLLAVDDEMITSSPVPSTGSSSPLLDHHSNSISSNSLGSYDSGSSTHLKNACEGIYNNGIHLSASHTNELTANSKKARLV